MMPARLLPALAVVAVAAATGFAALLDPAPLPRQAAVLPGLTAENAGNGSGLLVTSVENAGAAARAGIAVGDRITALDGHPVAGLGAARRYLRGDTRPVIDMRLHHQHSLRNVRLARPGDPHNVAQDTGRRR